MKKFKDIYTAKQLAKEIEVAGSVSAAARALCISRTALANFMAKSGDNYPRAKRGQHKIGQMPQHRDAVIVKPVAGGEVGSPDSRRAYLPGTRFVFTSAQNNTYINKKFWASLKNFCKHKKASLHVSRYTYNKSGFQNNFKDKHGLWYCKEIEPFILDGSAIIAEGLVFCGELDVIPTAEYPLSGFDSYAGYNSAIIPHSKIAMRSMPRLKGELPRFLYTTGTVTQRNYIQRKAGQKAEFHHVYGALYVEIDTDGYWFVRQLVADSKGEFHDLDKKYTPNGVKPGRVEAITWGDIHVEKEDREVSIASWDGPASILQVLRPAFQFVHDLTDFQARNHHELHSPHSNYKKFIEGKDSVAKDFEQSYCFLDKISKKSKVIVVESNHHEMFEKWLNHADGHRDPVNAEFWHEANMVLLAAIRIGTKDFDIYKWAIEQQGELEGALSNVQFLKVDESFTICGVDAAKNAIECGIHGHFGINGGRGKSSAYRSIGRRVNVGHSHSAGIIDGVYTAGVSGKLDMGYNRGASSWSHSHIVTYANGKRAIITIKNGRWHA